MTILNKTESDVSLIYHYILYFNRTDTEHIDMAGVLKMTKSTSPDGGNIIIVDYA